MNNSEVVYSAGVFKKVKKPPHFYISKYITTIGIFSVFYCFNKEKKLYRKHNKSNNKLRKNKKGGKFIIQSCFGFNITTKKK